MPTELVTRILVSIQAATDALWEPLRQREWAKPGMAAAIMERRRLFSKGGIRWSSASVHVDHRMESKRALDGLAQALAGSGVGGWAASPIVGGRERRGKVREMRDPADRRRMVGRACDSSPALVEEALKRATAAAPSWDARGGEERARAMTTRLTRAGVFAPAVSFPIVPQGEARLRLQVSAVHEIAELDEAAAALATAFAETT